MRFLILAGLALSACATAQTPETAPQTAAAPPSMADLLAQSPSSDWRLLDPQNTIYLDLPSGRVIIELAADYAPNHADNIRALARAGYFNGGAILRSQDNYVVQWGRPDDDPAPLGAGRETVEGEVARPRDGVEFSPLRDPDTYAQETGFSGGFPVARDQRQTWLTHCYGMVGSARGDGLGSGNGGQLYVVIGQSPRHLDRNITLVGRVIQGMELLSIMPRGTGALGFYETAPERTPIRSIRVAADVPEADRVNLEVLRTDSATFAAVLESRRTRREAWFVEPTGRINVCNAPLPVRARN